MAISKVTLEALSQMANLLQQSVEDIMSAKVEMDRQLRSFIWDDQTGYAFSAKYEEDFKPLTDKLIPAIDQYITHIYQLADTISYYSENSTISGMEGIMLGAGISLSGFRLANINRDPIENLTTDTCYSLGQVTGRTRAEDCSNQWEKRGLHLSKSKTQITAENYRVLTKSQLFDSLSIGTGTPWGVAEDDEIGPYNNGGGVAGIWSPSKKKILVNKDFLDDSRKTNDDVIELFFHEDRHRLQQDKRGNHCYQWFNSQGPTPEPKYVVPEKKCVEEIAFATHSSDISKDCKKQFFEYEDQFYERDARQAGLEAKKWFLEQLVKASSGRRKV